MPELPEVETTRRGLSPFLAQQQIVAVKVREARLRWPVPTELARVLPGLTIEHVGRRAKYLLLTTDHGTLIIHLGMSGSLRLVERGTPPNKHDHVDLVLQNGRCVRLCDPRRFGSILWTGGDPLEHPLLANLGPEPLSEQFHGEYLYQRSQGRRIAVKSFIMNSHVVVGLGNIYANEALYDAGIHPARRVHRIAKTRYERLIRAIKQVLDDAIMAGGTSVRDFVNSQGQPGYFSHSLRVYGRSGQACQRCGRTLQQTRIGQRSSIYCLYCQR
ncbi:MAG: bifunctional DNA-formamidopyrimidine glycosylase/DNA-(apurinic or apyrimidinic site) lyase [Gammaproteobacteria bacterium]|jgi:formamidopyrimidine-DNA glycosylase